MGIYAGMSKEHLGINEQTDLGGMQIVTADDKFLAAIKDNQDVMEELRTRLDNDEVLINNFLKNIVRSITSKLPLTIGK